MPTSQIDMIRRMRKWGNSLEVIAEEAGLPLSDVQMVIDHPTTHVRPPEVGPALAEAYEKLKPLSHVRLDSAPLLRHHRRIRDHVGSDARMKKALERARDTGRVSYATADELLIPLGLPVELVYGVVA